MSEVPYTSVRVVRQGGVLCDCRTNAELPNQVDELQTFLHE